MAHTPWQDHFRSALKKAEGLYSKNSTEVSLLMFCLRAKMIPSQEYLEWAKENFQLPVLAEKFIQLHPPQKEFFKKWQKLQAWSVECLPVAEWDGSLIVACLEPPATFPKEASVVFVLTSPEVLESAWKLYQKTEAPANAAITDMTALAATVISNPQEEKLYDENGAVVLKDEGEEWADSAEGEFQKGPSAESEGESLETKKTSSDSDNEMGGSPEGLFTDAPVPATVFAATEKASAPILAPSPAAPTAASTAVPSAASGPSSSAPLTPPASAPIMKVELSSGEKVKKGPRSSEPILKMEKASTAFLDDKTKTDTVLSKEDTNSLDEEIPSAPVKPTTLHTGSAAYFLEKVRKQNQDKFDKEALASLRKMKTFFKKALILAIGDKDRLIKPMVWDSEMEPPSSTLPEFNLKTPSIFKIVSGTQKPYHGYVVVNDLNESFFEVCNHGQIPDHVTIVPLLDGEMVVGMLMGLGEKSNYNKNVLEFSEAAAKEFAQKILKASLAKVA